MNIVIHTNPFENIKNWFALFELNLLFFEDYTVLWNEFSDEVPQGSAKTLAVQLLPVCEEVFAKYPLSDDFQFEPAFDNLYTEITGTILIWLDENGIQ